MAASVVVAVVAIPLLFPISFPREPPPHYDEKRGPASKLKVGSGNPPRLVNAFLS